LSDTGAYPHPAADVVVHHTHISVVFLAGSYAYKIKKPLDLGFLDFSSLERRRHFCFEEVRLNRRLAPGVYLGVVPVLERGGRIRMGAEPIAVVDSEHPTGAGELLDYAVWMKRLPDEATLESRVLLGEADAALVDSLARRIAAFHAGAASGERVAACGRWVVVARNCRENFEQSVPHVGVTVSPEVHARLRASSEVALERLRPLVERRAAAGVPRDTHGDLRLDHVYVFPDLSPPGDLVVVDCIEFNERFRYADPVADMAFLAMDLAAYGRRDLAAAFADAYFEASGDEDGRALLPFYTAYRAAVRGKVEGIEATGPDVPEHERAEALRRARAHWLLALGELEEPARRPCLVLVGGLPGMGKSTLARELERQAGFRVVSSDAVRKELAGLAASDRASAPFGEGLYTAEWNDRTYAECLRRVLALLFAGERVVVDASFREERRRRAFLVAARELAVPSFMLLCTADSRTALRRIAERSEDASDADASVYDKVAELWEEPGPLTREVLREIPTGADSGASLVLALGVLRSRDLA
jgi:aminoglycoside phosphotransferase family enzyme/predicted kinase